MMAINLDDLYPLISKLIPDLEEAQKEVDAEPDEERRKLLIAKYQPRWSELKPFMEIVSSGKCWYTESKNPGFDYDVDHYRPKNSVKTEKSELPHGGYYWLAFYWKNFRLSCSRGNRLRKNLEAAVTGGKGDRFQLLDPARRLRIPSRSQSDLDWEQPLLLDPTRPGDEMVLTFTETGYATISPAYKDNADEVKRVEASKLCYHLDWPEFRSDRVELYNLIERKVRRAVEIAPPKGASPLTWPQEFNLIVFDLLALRVRDQPYSSAARAYLAMFRSYWWIDLHVLQNPPSTNDQE